MQALSPDQQEQLDHAWIRLIAETNGLALMPSLQLFLRSRYLKQKPELQRCVEDFRKSIYALQSSDADATRLLQHPMALALRRFFREFPLSFREEHSHLTGALEASLLYPMLQNRLNGPWGELCRKKLQEVYGEEARTLDSMQDVKRLLTLKEGERFGRYLQVLYLPKILLIDRQSHKLCAYTMAKTMRDQFNVGFIRLKFTFSRLTNDPKEQIPGAEGLNEEEALLGLYEGFAAYRLENPNFRFVLSPCFRKEADFYDQASGSKELHFEKQVNGILTLIDRHPELHECLQEVDTVGDERELYRKEHFLSMQRGLRKLASRGFSIRSHHGETFHSLRRGIQAVDNAMNIWRIDTLEHGLSLGINPNLYYQVMLEDMIERNQKSQPIRPDETIGKELLDMRWLEHQGVLNKLWQGIPLNTMEEAALVKIKFHHARELEHYQHDVLNRVLDKSMSVTALPTSNKKLTEVVPLFKDHPFSWWEKKGVKLGIGTDNYVTLGTDYIKELLLVLIADPEDLKISKILRVATGEERRPYLSYLLWKMHQGKAELRQNE